MIVYDAACADGFKGSLLDFATKVAEDNAAAQFSGAFRDFMASPSKANEQKVDAAKAVCVGLGFEPKIGANGVVRVKADVSP